MVKRRFSLIGKTKELLSAMLAGYAQPTDYMQAVRSMEDSAKFQVKCRNYFF